MTEIRRFSLAYDGDEDRLAWDMADADGATTRLWLTQKLSRRLVGALAEILEKRTAADAPPAQRPVLQSWEQAAAMATFGKVPGVKPEAGATSGLVKVVHITAGDAGLSLVFEFAADGRRTIGLDPPAVRQTLALMHQLYVAAGWPMDFWPSWVASPAAPADAPALN